MQVTFVFVIAFIIPEILGFLLIDILADSSKKIDVVSLLKRNRIALGYLVITVIGYTLLLLPLLLAPIKPLDDEAAHLVRIAFLERILTLGSRLDLTLIGVAFTISIILISTVVLVASGMLGENRIQSFFQSLFEKTIISRIVHLIIGGVFCVLIVSSSLFIVDEWNIARFGPLQPVSYVAPLLLFGYTEVTLLILRMYNVLFMALSSVFIMKIMSDLLESYFGQKKNTNRIFEILGMIAGWAFLLYTPTIIFSAQVMLTAGVTLFFTLNCFLFIRLFKTSVDKISRIYLLSLFVSLAIGSLWKRVLLVQAATFILILLLWMISRPNQAESLKLWFKSCLVYLVIFGPWFIIVQLRGLVTRPYIADPTYLLPPGLFDYLFRLDLQMGIFWGILGYVSICLTLLIAIWKRSWILFTITPTYASWYVFFTLDAGWPHVVDRFFVPALSLLAISSLFLIGVFLQETMKFIVDSRAAGKIGISTPSTLTIKKITVLVVVIILLTPFAVGIGERAISIPQQIHYSVNNEYLAYDEAAAYVHGIINGDSNLLYSRFGQSGFNYYMRNYGKYFYSLSGFGDPWVPEEGNESAAAFIDYLRNNNYSVLAMPDAEFCRHDLANATAVIGELIVNYSSFGITEYRAFDYGETSFHVWSLQ
ncbi:MAG: hypothetical protein ACFFCX_14370 [Candidatus Sifarchaeia archaeon]